MFRIFKYLAAGVVFPLTLTAQVGYLSVDSPENTAVYLDSVLIATQPFSDLVLTPGKYTIRLDPAGDFSWQRRNQEQVVEIKPFEETVAHLNGISQITIFSNPIGSDVFAGSRYLGKTPIFTNRSIVGDSEIRIKRAGYREETLIPEAEVNTYTVNLELLDTGGDDRVFAAMPGGTEVNWFKESLVLTSFVSSWAAFLFKRKADDFYLQYQSASIPSRIGYFYDETEKYDRYSEVALGISAVSLGIYLFILMTD